jgi:(2Fe-2S) ferredoxin
MSDAPKLERHVFVCINERTDDDPRGHCVRAGAADVLDRLKGGAHDRGLKGRVRINKSGCLDQCAAGCSMVVYPDNVWYGRVTVADVDEILESHLINGVPVERLRTDVDSA